MTTSSNDADRVTPDQHAERNPSRSRVHRLAWLLDSSIRLPGGFRIGVDGIIGLIPGVGDLVAAALSSYIIGSAARMGVPASMLIRMGMNVLLELVVGAIPLFGDIFDFVFKANERNVRLIDAHLDEPHANRAQSRWIVASVIAFLLLVIGLALTVTIHLLGMLWGVITT